MTAEDRANQSISPKLRAVLCARLVLDDPIAVAANPCSVTAFPLCSGVHSCPHERSRETQARMRLRGAAEGAAAEDMKELDGITPLLRLKYHDSIADAVADLGRPDAIGETFAGFQRYLYEAQRVG